MASSWNPKKNALEFDDSKIEVKIFKSPKEVLYYTTDNPDGHEGGKLGFKKVDTINYKKNEQDKFRFVLTRGCFLIS